VPSPTQLATLSTEASLVCHIGLDRRYVQNKNDAEILLKNFSMLTSVEDGPWCVM